MSLRSLVSLSRRRPVRSAVRNPAARSPAAAARQGVEQLETRVFLSADVLTPVADTFVRDPSWNTTNFGDSPFLYVKNAGSGDDRRAFLRFNIGGFDDPIGNATLYLAGALQTPSTPPIEIGIYPVAEFGWVEGDGTIAVRDHDGGGGGSQLSGTSPGDGYDRDNSPSGEVTWDTQPTVVGPALTTSLVSRESFQTYAFDITAYIQQARQAGNQFVTLGVMSTQPTIHMTRFISREFDGPGRPQLVLTEAGDADGSVVRASVNAPDVTVGGSPSHAITVTYSGTAPIDLGTIDTTDIVVTRDGGNPIAVTDVTFDPVPSSTVTATYTVQRGSAWEITDNDLYTVHVRRGEVRDAEGNELVSNFSSFRARVFDTTAPTATVNAGNITGGGSSTYSFTVNYADNFAIDSQTINVNNVSVTDPNGGRHHPLRVTLSPDDGDASQILATYTIAAPGGEWGAEDNGTYTIILHTQTARDTAVNEVAEFVTPFDVNVQGPDVAGPTATISSGDITAESTGSHTVTVLYSDDRGINTGSIDIGDIVVTDPGGVALNVTDVDVSPGGGGSPQTAVYTIAPPSGGWNTNANGTYTVTLKPNEVSDSSDNFAAATTGGFNVNIAAPPPADTAPPTASISPVNLTAGGGGTHSITVTYQDNNAVIHSSIGRDDVIVTGPGGVTLGVSGVTAAPGTDAGTIAVTYQVDAPGGGTWDSEDDGAYNFIVKAGAVHDAAGNLNAEISAGFTVDIGGPDTAGPSSDIQVEDVTVAGGATHQISITYTDDGKVDFTTIDAGDITVVRESDGLVLSVTAGTSTQPGHGSPKTGVYTIAAPGGSWDATDDGVYRVTLLAGAVTDRKPNPAATNSRTFSVRTAVVDTTPPTASIAPPAPVTTAGDALVSILVTYSDNQPLSDTVIDAEDLVLTGPDGVPFAATTAQVLPGTDPNTLTVRYDFAAPGGTWDVSDNGTYSISLAPGQVVDAAGNDVTLVGTGQLVVDVPAPNPIDPVFGSGNPIATNFVVEAVTAQADGKLLLVGRRGVAGTPETVGVIQRRNSDGALDTGFGGGDGEVVTDAGQGVIYYAVGIQNFENGRFMIVVAGTSFGAVDGDFVAARYDAAGNLDTTFGAGGRAFVDFGQPGEAAYGLAVGPDNKVLLGGGSADHFAFARLSPDGSLDATFAQGGKNLFDADGVDVVGAVAIQRDGKILAAGSSGPNVVVIRLDVNGEKDLGFADRGVFIVPGLRSRLEAQDQVDRSQAIAVQSDDKILVGNYTAEGNNFGIARIDLAGRLDPTFGTAGIASVDLGGNDDVDAVVIQESGEILAVGTTDAGGPAVTAVAAFNTSGQLITGFGENGVLRFDPAVSTPGREVHIGDLVLRAFGTRQADGRLVVTSSDRRPDPTSSSLRRLNVPGTRALPQGTSIGTFGATAGSRRRGQRLVDTVTGAIFTMKGGSGEAFRGDDGRINLILADGGAGVVVNVKARGRVPLGDIICRGNIRSLNIRTGDLSGTLFVGGMLFRARLGNVAGGTIAVNGAITSLLVDNLDQAKVLSGANLGEDARLGGTESNADVFGVGVIGAVRVRGQIVNSIVAAGLNPNDGVIGNDDDTVTANSTIRTLSARSADDNSRFYASTFGNVRLPRRVDPAADPRFETA